jgi:hypothetical protein
MFPRKNHHCWFTVYDRSASPIQKPLLSLLYPRTTCRQIYAEAKLLPFTLNPISAYLRLMLNARKSMPREIVECIRAVEISGVWSVWSRDGSGTLRMLVPFKALTRIHVDAERISGVTPDVVQDVETWLGKQKQRRVDGEEEVKRRVAAKKRGNLILAERRLKTLKV